MGPPPPGGVGLGVGVGGRLGLAVGLQAIITIMMLRIQNITHPCLRMLFIVDLLSLCEIENVDLELHYVTIIYNF